MNLAFSFSTWSPKGGEYSGGRSESALYRQPPRWYGSTPSPWTATTTACTATFPPGLCTSRYAVLCCCLGVSFSPFVSAFVGSVGKIVLLYGAYESFLIPSVPPFASLHLGRVIFVIHACRHKRTPTIPWPRGALHGRAGLLAGATSLEG